MPENDLRLITDAAQQASEIALKYWRTDQRVDQKDGGSPVSEGDFAVDNFLRSNLTAARPEYGWLSEETEDDKSRLKCKRAFVVDPIDGTRAYVAGENTWGISIAVVENGQPLVGVVYLPVREKLYSAITGSGSWLNGATLRTSEEADPKRATTLAPKQSLDPKWWPSEPPALDRHWRSSLAYRFCLVAEGKFDSVLTIRDAFEWDIAAGILIAAEAGAKISDRNGEQIVLNQSHPKASGVFAANPGLHKRLVDLYNGGH